MKTVPFNPDWLWSTRLPQLKPKDLQEMVLGEVLTSIMPDGNNLFILKINQETVIFSYDKPTLCAGIPTSENYVSVPVGYIEHLMKLLAQAKRLPDEDPTIEDPPPFIS
jgi:hypothetical protein